MCLAVMILIGSAVIWAFSFYQLMINFWPMVIQTMATGEAPFWYRNLYPFVFYAYLLSPFVFLAAAVYLLAAWVRRRFMTAKES